MYSHVSNHRSLNIDSHINNHTHPTHVVDVRKGIQYSSLTPLERECYDGEILPKSMCVVCDASVCLGLLSICQICVFV